MKLLINQTVLRACFPENNLTNKYLIKQLKKEDNIKDIETLLNKKNKNAILPSQRNIKTDKKSKESLFENIRYTCYNSKKNNSIKEFKKRFPQICHEINSYFNIYDVNKPQIRISNTKKFNGYYFNQICLEENIYHQMILTATHEYIHHIISKKVPNLNYRYYSYFEEGMARGLENHIAKIYANKEKDERYLIQNCSINCFEFLQVYFKLCEKFNKKPLKKWNKEKKMIEGLTIGSHAIGNTIFSLYEMKSGEDIYRKNMYKLIRLEKN